MSPSLVLNPVCLPFYFSLVCTAMKESGVQWSVANEEDYKNGERLVIKHNKVHNNSKNDLLFQVWYCVSLIGWDIVCSLF